MPPDKADIEVIEQHAVYQGYYRMDHYHLRHRLYEGGWSEDLSRELFERGHIVAVVLYDPILDKLVMIEQFRLGAYAAGWQPWLIEIIAGGREAGEIPEEVARREAKEEADCEIRDLVHLCRFLAIPAACSETTEVFCGLVDASDTGGIHGLDSEHEDIRVMAVPVGLAMEWLDRGDIVNARTMIGLQWFRMRHKELQARWRS